MQSRLDSAATLVSRLTAIFQVIGSSDDQIKGDFAIRGAVSLIRPSTSRIVSEICGDQIVRASAAADVDLGSGGTY